MTNIFNIFVSSVTRRTNKELFGALHKYNMSHYRTVKIWRAPIQSLLCSRTVPNKITYSVMKSSIRFTSEKTEKKEDRFIPKDPFKNKSIWKPTIAFFVLLGTGISITVYFKNKMLKKMEIERNRALGKIDIGGKFELVDSHNNVRKSDEFLGNWLLIYFGFTHCPDICPDELEKMVQVIDRIEKDKNLPNVTPIFITVDPQRDTPSVVGKYVKEFSDKIIGLTGTVEQIAAVCKAYRVYFSAGPKDKDEDYIVDHSIIMYLMNPEGEFMDYYGRNRNVDQILDSYRFNVQKHQIVNDKGLFKKLFS